MRRLILLVSMIIALSFSTVVFADDTADNSDGEPTRYYYQSATVADNDGNRYLVQAGSNAYGVTAEFYTYFKNTFVHNGEPSTQAWIQSQVKTLGGKANASTINGAPFSFGELYNTVSYTLESNYNPSHSVLYTVGVVSTNHLFSFNGAYWYATTTYPS